jgi:tripartite-type tricarboxylate transporter receptor subunit TctC
MHRRNFVAMTAALALLAGAPLASLAADYPAKPITFVVPWPAGGTTDIIGRLLADAMSADLGKPIAVVNRVGAGGSLGSKAALDAPKDGYTVLVTTSGNQILTPLKKDVGYTSADFVAIGQIASRTLALGVKADAPWKSLADLQKDARANPGKYTFGAVPNVMPFLTLDTWAKLAGVQLTLVPQKGGAPGVTGTLGGHLNMVPESLSSMNSHLKAGTMRALAVFNEERDPAAPDVPTAKEQGFPVFGNPFTGLAVAKGTPDAAVNRLRQAMAKAAQDPAFQDKAKKAGSNVTYLDGDAFGKVWARDWAAYAPVLQKK